MTAKHTPGPWRVGKKYPADVVSEDGRITVARIHHQSAAWYSEVVANATLIAAAPDMLEALQQAAATFRKYEALHRVKGTPDSEAKAVTNAALAARFEAIIAKATGETV